jgi:cytochrome c peroxidase
LPTRTDRRGTASFGPTPETTAGAASLEDHNAAAITFDQDPAELVKELNAVTDYRTRFARVFGGEITFKDVTRALGAFERTVLTFNSPFDRFRAGERSALNSEQQEGLALFNGKAGCSSCHVPPLFIDNGFHALGVPDPGFEDPGRFAVTGDDRDRGAFRTPTLRNVALTAPYMHNGALPTLGDVVAFYDAGGGVVPGGTSPAIRPLHLTEPERQALVAFLESLTDTSAAPAATAVERRP